MPDLRKCVKDKDRIYCWDDELGEVVEIKVIPVPITECPKEVLVRMIRDGQDSSPASAREVEAV
jgi:hypothetical protein